MALAPLTPPGGPHVVRASRLAFTTPVREAGGAGHWITLHSAEDPESGTCHVWVNGGSGPGSGTITKGPKGLLHQHIAALASHSSVSKAQHHPVGHEPPGARDHPHYAEAAPTPPVAPGEAGKGEATKRPGKPYARLSGADQGTRAEQIGKALSEAQEAARGAKAEGRGAKAEGGRREAGAEQGKPASAFDLLTQAKARGTSPWLTKHQDIRAERAMQRDLERHGHKDPAELRLIAAQGEHVAAGPAHGLPAGHTPESLRETARRLRALADQKHPQDKTRQAVQPPEGTPASARSEEAPAKAGKGTFGQRREATVKAMQEKQSHRGTPYRVLGVSDDVTTCEICGKPDLKRTVALHNEDSGVVRAGSDCAAMLLRTSRATIEKAARQHGEKREAAIEKALQSHPNQEIIKRFAGQIQRITAYHRGQKTTPSESDQSRMAFARQRMAELTAEARRDIEKQLPPDKPLPESGQAAPSAAKPFAAPEKLPEEKIADSAVAHQQAQADLAAHRASADRNPNPWAPHLSPPVGDAKDRELQEKATRAQMALQAAQAQQIEAAHQRLQQQAAQPRDQAQPVVHSVGKPGESDSEREQRLLAEHKEHKARFDTILRAELGEAGHKERRDLVERMNDIGGEVQDIRDKRQGLGSHAPGNQPAHTNAQSKPAFSAPQPKATETPQLTPQPEQPAHPYEGDAHEHVAALPQAVRDTLTKAGVTVQQHQGSQAEALPGHGVSTPMATLGPADAGYDSRTGIAHFFGGQAQRYDVHHEMGHALDDALGYQATGKHHTPSSSLPAFQALYHKHKENMDLPPPMRHSPSEMFADAFAMHHDVLHQEGETADGEPRMVHRGRTLERAAPDLHAHIAALSKHPPERKVRESAGPAPGFSAPCAR